MQQARTLRIMQVIFILYILSLFWLLRFLPAPPGQHSMTSLAWIFVCIALLCAVLGFVLQSWLLRAPANPNAVSKSSPAKRWFAGHVFRMSCSLAVSLYGVVLHTLGTPKAVSLSLIALGLILILFWSPGELPGGEQQGNQ
jgi:hypothetical protein